MPAGLNRAPHVLMSADAIGGVWTYALDLAEGLLAAGARVTLAVLGPPPSAGQRRRLAAIEGLAVEAVDGPLDWTATREAELAAPAEALARLARRTKADLIHLNSPALAGLVRFDRPVLGACHSCTSTWWSAVRGGDLPPDFAWRKDLLTRGYRTCDDLIAPTRAFAEATAAHYAVRPFPAPNGRRRTPVPGAHKRERFALTAGRLWDEGKDLVTLDRAAARAAYPIVALGPLHGPGGARVRPERLKAPGAAQSPNMVADWMACAPVFVSAALYEPFGLAALEAAQAGAALVLSDIPTFRELWDGAAIFVPPRDADGFAAALDGLLSDEARRRAMAGRALARARRYTVAAMTRAVLARYERLAPASFSASPEEAAA